MPRVKQKINEREAISKIVQGLKLAAVRPNIYGYTPHEKQTIFHASPARKRLFAGGNRSGKTVGGATEAVWWLTGTHPFLSTPEPPVRGRVVSVDFLNGVEQIVRPEIARWLPHSAIKGGSWENGYSKETHILELENGSTLEFMSYEQDVEKFAGTSRHFIWFDEEPPREIYEECTLRLVDTGGSLWITMTPTEGMTWTFDELYMKAKSDDEDTMCVEVEMTQNPYINYGEVESFLSGLTDDEREMRLKGRFVEIGGLIYKMFDPKKHIIEPFKPPEEWLHVASMDHGYNNPTAWLWAVINPDGDVFVYDEHYESGKIVREHAHKVHEINAKHGRVPDYYVGDPSIRNVDPITGTSILMEYIEHGVVICLGNNDQRAGLNRVSRYLTGINDRPRLYITKNCTNLLIELPRLRWSTWASKKLIFDKNKKEEQHKKNDHACDALRYLIASRPEYDDGKDILTPTYDFLSEFVDLSKPVIDTDLVPQQRRHSDYAQVADFTLGSEY